MARKRTKSPKRTRRMPTANTKRKRKPRRKSGTSSDSTNSSRSNSSRSASVSSYSRSRSRLTAAGTKSKRQKSCSPPRYEVMVTRAIRSLDKAGGSSRDSIVKYIMEVFHPSEKPPIVDRRIKTILRDAVKDGVLVQCGGKKGHFKMGKKNNSRKKSNDGKPLFAPNAKGTRSGTNTNVGEPKKRRSRQKPRTEGDGDDDGAHPGNQSMDVWIFSPEDGNNEAAVEPEDEL